MCGPREGHMQSGDWDISLVKLDRDEEIEIYARSSLSKSTDNKEGRYDGEQGIVSGREMYNERVGVRGRHWHSNEVGWIEAIANVSPNWNSSLGESLSYCSRLLQEKPYNTLLFLFFSFYQVCPFATLSWQHVEQVVSLVLPVQIFTLYPITTCLSLFYLFLSCCLFFVRFFYIYFNQEFFLI